MAKDDQKETTEEQDAAARAATHTQGAGVPPIAGESSTASPDKPYYNTADNVYVASTGRVEDGALQPEGTGMGRAGGRVETGDAAPGEEKVDAEKVAESQRQADAIRDGRPIGAAVEVTPPSAEDHAVLESRADGQATDAKPLADAPRQVKQEPKADDKKASKKGK